MLIFIGMHTMCTNGYAQPGFVGTRGLKLVDGNLPPKSIKLITPASLSSDHTFTLPPASAGIFKSNSTGVMSIGAVDLGTSDITGVLSPGNISLPTNNVLVGNGSNVAQAYPPGAPNTILSINGSNVPTWQTLATLGGVNGSGTATQVAFFNGTVGNPSTTLSSSPNLFWNNTTGSLGIGGTPTASSALSINSTTQGFLAPRMDLSERNLIGSPATGLLIYQTDNNPGFYYYNGSQWVSLVPSSGGVGSVVFKRKTTTQTITRNGVGTTSSNDNDLFFSVAAGETWEFEVVGYLSVDQNGLALLSAVTTGGINLSNAANAGGFIFEALSVSVLGIVGVGIDGRRNQDVSASGDHLNSIVNINLGVLGGATVSDTYVKMKGFIRGGAVGTTVNVKWSQAISVGVLGQVVLDIEPNSYLKATRVE